MKRCAVFFGICLLALNMLVCLPQPGRASAPRAGLPAAPERRSFYLKDGDRVLFYGDSITEQHLYTTYIESYCVTRFPKRRFTFINSGWSGDRVTGGGGGPIDTRIRRDILAYKPTVVTICLGMNDGSYRAFDPEIFRTYVTGYRHLLDTLQKELPGVRITLLTAPAYDDVTRTPNFPGGYNATLLAYGEAVQELGREYGLVVADTNTPLVAALAEGHSSNAELAAKIIPDRVHPGPGGHMVMAAAVLKAWNAPDVVANIAIDAGSGQIVRHDNTRLSDVRIGSDTVRFTHLDGALPWPLDRDPQKNVDMELALAVTGNDSTLNRYLLTVTHLTPGSYILKVDGHDVTTLSSDALQQGIDLAALPDLPANRQAQQVLALTYQHNNLHFRRWRQVQLKSSPSTEQIDAATQREMDGMDAQEVDIVRQQRAAVLPTAHTIELVRVP